MVARKTSSLPTRIYTYSARAPLEGEARVEVLLDQSSRYYNQLIGIERERLHEYRQTRCFYAPELGALEEDFEAAVGSTAIDRDAQIKESSRRLRAAAKSFEASIEAAREEFSRRKKERGAGVGPRARQKINQAVFAEMLAESEWPEAWKDLAQADDDAHERKLKARAECKLPPGCYLMVEAAAEAAIRDSRPSPPEFSERRWRKIGVQVTPPIDVSTLLSSGCSKLSLKKASAQRSRSDTLVTLSAGEAPLTFPVLMYRPLPPDGIVKWAWVKCITDEFTDRISYEMQFVVEAKSFERKISARAKGKSVTVVPTSEVTRGGIIVARWSSGMKFGQIFVPQVVINRLSFSGSLRQVADRLLTHAYRIFRFVCRKLGHRITHWSTRRSSRESRELLKRVIRHWIDLSLPNHYELWQAFKATRLSTRSDLYVGPNAVRRFLKTKGISTPNATLAFWSEIWLRKDTHLRVMARNIRASSERRRREIFRVESNFLQKEFEKLVINNEPMKLPASVAIRDAAAGECREILCERFGVKLKTAESIGIARNQESAEESRDPSMDLSELMLDSGDPSSE